MTDGLERVLVQELAGASAASRVLDVGCGDGVLASLFVREGVAVVGIDADRAMLEAARARARASGLPLMLVQGRAECLPFADERFDLVTAVTVLCFVRDEQSAVAEMKRVLRGGGRLVLGELGRRSIWALLRRIRGWLGARTWRNARFHSARNLRSLVAGAGLSPGRVRGAIFYPPLAVFARIVAPLDRYLGCLTTFGAAFLALAAVKPPPPASLGAKHGKD
ncbi:MAG: class I SAM-dependent methyltransferase [Bradyrhizobiaceae bacterium]|nr:class I SAM-dependent methyltransferase [Bradyrhizobiaceae bacterium]